MYVNILTDKYIPYINLKGPLFGYNISEGVYPLLRYAPYPIEIVNSEEDVISAKKRWKEERSPKKSESIILNDSITVTDNFMIKDVILEKQVDDFLKPGVISDSDDLEIDSLLDSEEYKSNIISSLTEVNESEDVKHYTDDEINNLTKKQCKEILESRGYKSSTEKFVQSSQLAAKYHDTVEDLRRKVKITQSL